MDVVEPFFVKHNQRNLISDEYRNRLVNPNNTFGLRRRSEKDIYLVSVSTDIVRGNMGAIQRSESLSFTKYDQVVNGWVGIKTIALEPMSKVRSMVVANEKLYVMGGIEPYMVSENIFCGDEIYSKLITIRSYSIDVRLRFEGFHPDRTT